MGKGAEESQLPAEATSLHRLYWERGRNGRVHPGVMFPSVPTLAGATSGLGLGLGT